MATMVQISRQLTMLETVDNQLKEVSPKTMNISIPGASNVVLRFISRHRLLISRLTVRCTLTQTNLKLVRAFPGDFGISKDKKRALRGGDFGYHITDVRTYFGNNQAV